MEWQTEAVSVEARKDAVEVTLESERGEPETLRAPWLIGCDGASSFVRQLKSSWVIWPGCFYELPSRSRFKYLDAGCDRDVSFQM